MTVKEVLMIGNPQLRETSSEISTDDAELPEILTDLKDTLTHLQGTKRIGRALAAPQIGHFKKVIYFQFGGNIFYMLNPEILERSEDMITVWDSCYSFDVAFFVRIPRHRRIKVRFWTAEGEERTEEYTDDLSELVQHETDHLIGVLATDHLTEAKGNIVLREEWERRFRT
jgi:peptide deformylase